MRHALVMSFGDSPFANAKSAITLISARPESGDRLWRTPAVRNSPLRRAAVRNIEQLDEATSTNHVKRDDGRSRARVSQSGGTKRSLRSFPRDEREFGKTGSSSRYTRRFRFTRGRRRCTSLEACRLTGCTGLALDQAVINEIPVDDAITIPEGTSSGSGNSQMKSPKSLT